MVIARITPRVRILLEPFGVTNYEIREADYADYDINDPFAIAFIDALQPELLAIKLCVTDTHFMTLVTEIVNIVVTRFEAYDIYSHICSHHYVLTIPPYVYITYIG